MKFIRLRPFAMLVGILLLVALTACARARPEEPTATPAAGGAAAARTPAALSATPTPTSPVATPQGQPTTLAIRTPTPAPAVGGQAAGGAATPIPTITPTPLPTPPTSVSAPAQERVHIVQPGENLFRIALRYGFDVDTVARYNNITNPALIYVGQKIKIPPDGRGAPGGGQTYIVKPGDTLQSIAARFNTTVQALMSANNLTNPDLIYVGQKLRVP